MKQKQWSTIKLYQSTSTKPTSPLYNLHKQLSALVLQACGFSPNDYQLEKLLALNLNLVEKGKTGEAALGPSCTAYGVELLV
jgi:hypothetical protein